MNRVFFTRADFLYPLILATASLALFLSGAPTHDAFSWPDAPRHALNGAFVLDFLRDMPLRHPTRYAYDYYAKYPALTILFYPPLFYLFLAAFYALFGVSQSSALVAEFVCYVALAAASYRLARFWLAPLAAFGAALILTGAPEIAYWGRQVMLEIPSMALMVWSAVFFMRHLREERVVWLYVAVGLAVLAMYTKLTTLFILPVYLAVLLQRRGFALFKDRHAFLIVGLTVVALVPLIVITLKFGQANIQSVSGIADEKISRTSLAGWIWYASQMPSQLGWPALLAALAGLALTLRKPSSWKEFAPLLWWLALGYLFFSAIALKEARHSILLLVPLVVFAAVGIQRFLINRPALANGSIVLIGVVTLYQTAFAHPVEYVAGYDKVADYIANVAPKDSVVVFSGYRDGSFIFAMRTHSERRDLSVVRSDKLLLQISVRRELGVHQKLMSQEDIIATLDRLGVQYVVAQPDFWTDLKEMRRFEDILHSAHFREVKRFVMHANYHAQEKELVIYRSLDRVAHGPIQLNIAIPMINSSISGTIGDQK